MKESFQDKNFNHDALKLIATCNAILNAYEKQGYDLSLRQLYYQLVSQNIIKNEERSYKNLGVLVSDARMAGMIDWAMIKDRGRSMERNPHWGDPADFMKAVAPQYRFDLWADQDCYVEVMVEKQALEGVLLPVCRRWDIPFTANKGYTSSSAAYEASKRFLERKEQNKDCYVIYLGDHDPSGLDMSRDIEDRLDLFVKTSAGREDEIGPNEEPAVTVRRVALNIDQIRKLRPPENPAKLTDSRARAYVELYGDKSWELDAIEPRQLAALVDRAVEDIIDMPLFEANLKKMEEGRAALLKFAEEYDKPKKGKKK